MEGRPPFPALRRSMPEHDMSLSPVSRVPAHHRGPTSCTLWVGQVSSFPVSNVLQPPPLQTLPAVAAEASQRIDAWHVSAQKL